MQEKEEDIAQYGGADGEHIVYLVRNKVVKSMDAWVDICCTIL